MSFKSLHERTWGRRVPLARVKAMKPEGSPGRFSAPADQLPAGEQITLMDPPTRSRSWNRPLGAAGKWPSYQHLHAMPGIGQILGRTIALETGEAQRFADAGHFASYSRCVKSLRTSNGKKTGENNCKCGNQYLAWAFVEVAHCACRHGEQCRRFYDRKKQQTNPVIATKVLACELAKAAWPVMMAHIPLRRRAPLQIRPEECSRGDRL